MSPFTGVNPAGELPQHLKEEGYRPPLRNLGLLCVQQGQRTAEPLLPSPPVPANCPCPLPTLLVWEVQAGTH
jgi:hypothetical protein